MLAMKKLARYDTPEDLKMRLDHSLVLYKGQPYFINTSKLEIYLLDISQGNKLGPISPDDPDLDLSSPELGYCLTGPYAHYIARYPFRRQKQGLDVGNLLDIREESLAPVRRVELNVEWSAVVQAIKGEYKTLPEIWTMFARGDFISIPFHRKFALVRTRDTNVFQVSYAGTRIGLLTRSDNTLVISKAYDRCAISEDLSKFFTVKSVEDVDANARPSELL